MTVTASASDVTNSGKIQASDQVKMDIAALSNTDSGHINADNTINIKTVDYGNTGDISTKGDATLTLKNNRDLTLTAQTQVPVASDTLTLNVHNLNVNIDTMNPGSIVVNAGGAVQNNQSLQSGNDLTVSAGGDVVNTGQMTGKNVTVTASASDVTNSGKIQASDQVKMDIAALSNTDSGHINADNTINIKTVDYGNTGDISTKGDATLTLKNNRDLTLTAQTQVPVASDTLTLNVHNLNVNIDTMNPGSIVVNAGGAVQNNQSLQSGNNLTVSAGGDVVNAAASAGATTGALLWAAQDVAVTAGGTLDNQNGAQIQAQRDVRLTASTVTNHEQGQVTAERDLWVDAGVLNNLASQAGYNGPGYTVSSTLSAPSASATNYVPGGGVNGGPNTWQRQVTVTISNLVGPDDINSTLSLPNQGQLQGNRNVNLNQDTRKDTKAVVNNAGRIQAGSGDLVMNGVVNNVAPTKQMGLMDLLSQPATISFWGMQETIGGSWALLDKNAYRKSFGSVKDMLNYALDGGTSNYFGVYYIDHSQLMDAVKQAAKNNRSLTGLLNAALGADWAAQDNGTLQGRWANAVAQGSNLPGKELLPGQYALLSAGGQVQQNGGTLANGEAAQKSSGVTSNGAVQQNGGGTAVQQISVASHQNQAGTLQIGSYTVPTYTGNFNASVNLSDLVQTRDLSGVLKALKGNTHLFVLNGAHWDGGSGPFQSVANVSQVGPSVYPVYETRAAYVNQGQYRGTDYFLNSIGFKANERVRAIGDNYFVNQLISQQAQALSGGYLASLYHESGNALVASLMDNAGAVAGGLGLQLGVAPTADQLSKLDKDIVWYVTQTVDDAQVLVPQVYLANSTVEAEKRLAQGGSAAVLGGRVEIKKEDKVEQVSNINGTIYGKDEVSIYSTGNLTNLADGGLAGGIRSGKAVTLTANGDITNDGAQVVGDGVTLHADGAINVTAHMGYAFGDAAITNKGSLQANNGKLNLTAEHGVSLTAADLSGNNVTVAGGQGAVTTNTLNIGGSHYSGEHSGGIGYGSDSTDTQSWAKAADTTIQAGQGGTLTMTGNGITLNGGNYSGGSATLDAGDGDLTIKTAQDYSYSKQTKQDWAYVAGASAGAGDAAASANYSANPNDSADANGNQGANQSGAPQASARTGFQMSSSTDTDNAKTNRNASLKFNNAITLKSANTVDIGGADLMVTDQKNGTLSVDAGTIASTKYQDEDQQTHHSDSMFVGIEAEGHSSLLNLAGDAAQQGQKRAAGMKEGDAAHIGSQAATYAGDVTQALFGDTGGASVKGTIEHSSSDSSSRSSSDNMTHLSAGHITLTSRKGDITLNGVQAVAAQEMVLDSAGNVNVNAAKSSSSSTQSGSNEHFDVSVSASTNALTEAAGAGFSIGGGGGKSGSNSSDTTYTNSSLSASNLTVKAKKDLSLVGANATGDNVTLTVGGNVSVKSVQDEHTSSSWSNQVEASVGANFNSHSGMGVNFNVSDTQTNDKDHSLTTTTRAGIVARQQLNADVTGDVNLVGASIASDTGAGNVTVGGKVSSTDLVDVHDKSGFTTGGGFGLGVDGMANVSVSGGAHDAIHDVTVQHGALAVNTVTAAGGVDANTKRSQSQATEVKQVDHEAGSIATVTAGSLMNKHTTSTKTEETPDGTTHTQITASESEAIEKLSDYIKNNISFLGVMSRTDVVASGKPFSSAKVYKNTIEALNVSKESLHALASDQPVMKETTSALEVTAQKSASAPAEPVKVVAQPTIKQESAPASGTESPVVAQSTPIKEQAQVPQMARDTPIEEPRVNLATQTQSTALAEPVKVVAQPTIKQESAPASGTESPVVAQSTPIKEQAQVPQMARDTPIEEPRVNLATQTQSTALAEPVKVVAQPTIKQESAPASGTESPVVAQSTPIKEQAQVPQMARDTPIEEPRVNLATQTQSTAPEHKSILKKTPIEALPNGHGLTAEKMAALIENKGVELSSDDVTAIYSVNGDDGKALAYVRTPVAALSLEEDAKFFDKLRDMGIPVVRNYGVTRDKNGDGVLILERIRKPSPEDSEKYANKIIENLIMLRNRIADERVSFGNLRLLYGEGGRVAVDISFGGIQFGVPESDKAMTIKNLKAIDHAIEDQLSILRKKCEGRMCAAGVQPELEAMNPRGGVTGPAGAIGVIEDGKNVATTSGKVTDQKQDVLSNALKPGVWSGATKTASLIDHSEAPVTQKILNEAIKVNGALEGAYRKVATNAKNLARRIAVKKAFSIAFPEKFESYKKQLAYQNALYDLSTHLQQNSRSSKDLALLNLNRERFLANMPDDFSDKRMTLPGSGISENNSTGFSIGVKIGLPTDSAFPQTSDDKNAGNYKQYEGTGTGNDVVTGFGPSAGASVNFNVKHSTVTEILQANDGNYLGRVAETLSGGIGGSASVAFNTLGENARQDAKAGNVNFSLQAGGKGSISVEGPVNERTTIASTPGDAYDTLVMLNLTKNPLSTKASPYKLGENKGASMLVTPSKLDTGALSNVSQRSLEQGFHNESHIRDGLIKIGVDVTSPEVASLYGQSAAPLADQFMGSTAVSGKSKDMPLMPRFGKALWVTDKSAIATVSTSATLGARASALGVTGVGASGGGAYSITWAERKGVSQKLPHNVTHELTQSAQTAAEILKNNFSGLNSSGVLNKPLAKIAKALEYDNPESFINSIERAAGGDGELKEIPASAADDLVRMHKGFTGAVLAVHRFATQSDRALRKNLMPMAKEGVAHLNDVYGFKLPTDPLTLSAMRANGGQSSSEYRKFQVAVGAVEEAYSATAGAIKILSRFNPNERIDAGSQIKMNNAMGGGVENAGDADPMAARRLEYANTADILYKELDAEMLPMHRDTLVSNSGFKRVMASDIGPLITETSIGQVDAGVQYANGLMESISFSGNGSLNNLNSLQTSVATGPGTPGGSNVIAGKSILFKKTIARTPFDYTDPAQSGVTVVVRTAETVGTPEKSLLPQNGPKNASGEEKLQWGTRKLFGSSARNYELTQVKKQIYANREFLAYREAGDLYSSTEQAGFGVSAPILNFIGVAGSGYAASSADYSHFNQEKFSYGNDVGARALITPKFLKEITKNTSITRDALDDSAKTFIGLLQENKAQKSAYLSNSSYDVISSTLSQYRNSAMLTNEGYFKPPVLGDNGDGSSGVELPVEVYGELHDSKGGTRGGYDSVSQYIDKSGFFGYMNANMPPELSMMMADAWIKKTGGADLPIPSNIDAALAQSKESGLTLQKFLKKATPDARLAFYRDDPVGQEMVKNFLVVSDFAAHQNDFAVGNKSYKFIRDKEVERAQKAILK
ncbi:hemagglutinin repeat-containing protein [Burkholderia ubonensis]|uniref:hemagglutinin repeat-containing protein n=1 Tax=Burkholderia ubonensis TaxID=101571 RepID=UPI001E3B7F7C|nr:hemagglutinin repeat-containing protein [Burkholderia ubonensis]